MHIIRKYVTVNFIIASVSAVAVLTFIMCIGMIFKATDLISRGVAWWPILKITLYGIPETFAYTMPLGILVASLLVFGRLSTDGEIMAMKACGVDVWQIVTGPLLVSLLFMTLCLQINTVMAPENHYSQRNLTAAVRVKTPSDLLDEGRFIQDFDGLTMYIGKKKGTFLTNVRIYDAREGDVKREIWAKSGEVKTSDTGKDLIMDLFDVRVSPPPFSDDEQGAVFMDRWPVSIPNVMAVRKHRKNEKDMTVGELVAGVRYTSDKYPDFNPKDLVQQRMSLLVELNKRVALSVACFAFALMGIPLGISTDRRKSSIGAGVSLFLAFCFYLFIIVAKSLSKHPEWSPDLITWTPVIISLVLGMFLIRKTN